jgi:hypothetical protein
LTRAIDAAFAGWIFASTRCSFILVKVWRSTSCMPSVM